MRRPSSPIPRGISILSRKASPRPENTPIRQATPPLLTILHARIYTINTFGSEVKPESRKSASDTLGIYRNLYLATRHATFQAIVSRELRDWARVKRLRGSK